jgi:ectoine hydroxylase-related dioxygenase (phytanoyl-CoA dioxygenase family)
MPPREIIRDSEIVNSLNELGVAQVRFTDSSHIDTFQQCFDDLHPQWNEAMKSGYYFSIFGDGKEYRQKIIDMFTPLLLPHIKKLFSNFKILTVIAQVKGVGEESEVNIHQDLTVVEESKYKSYTLWIPLVDSTVENGAISFLESSHIGLRNYRCHTVEYLFKNTEGFIRNHSQLYPIKTGKALLFDPATLHFSGSNISESPRVSIAVSIVDQDAPTEILFYDKQKPFDGLADRYSVPEDFWMMYEDFITEKNLAPSFGNLIGKRNGIQVLPYSENQFLTQYWSGYEKASKMHLEARTHSVLKNGKLQNELNESGFIVRDFLEGNEIKRLQTIFNTLHDNRSDIPFDKLYTCQHNSDANYRECMNAEIEAVLAPVIAKHFNDIKNTVCTYQIKGIGDNSELYPHQDWNFTREDEGFRTYTLWISLIDSDETNGTLAVLPGSHLRLTNVRGAKIDPIFSGMQNETIPYLSPLKIKAGQLVLFDSALLHYSSANNSNDIRVSVMTNIIPEQAKVCLYFGKEDSPELAEEYLVPDDFFLRYENFAEEYERPPSFGELSRSVKIHSKIYHSTFNQLFPEMIGRSQKDVLQ